MLWRFNRLRPETAGAAALLSVALALLAFAGMVSAHAPKPSTISLTPTGGLSIQASGTWAWKSQATVTTQYYLGYAIDWGDISSGNAVGTYHIGDGTAATNLVLQNVSPAAGSSGTWGPTSHTYASPGTYTVCVLMYDLGPKLPPPTTGWWSTRAGGSGHNADNSVEELNVPAFQCATIQVAAATPTPIVTAAPTLAPSATPTAALTPSAALSPTPLESFQGTTASPKATAPATSTGQDGSSGGSGTVPAMLLVASGLFAMVSVGLARRSKRRT